MSFRMIGALLALSLVACGGGGAHVAADPTSSGDWQQRLSSGVLGCRPGHVEISEHYAGFTDSWVATCAGGQRTIICGWARGSGAPLCTDLIE